jgi:hypothetical protein
MFSILIILKNLKNLDKAGRENITSKGVSPYLVQWKGLALEEPP